MFQRIRAAKEIDSELKISRIFGITQLKKEKRVDFIQKILINDIRNYTEDVEEFLRHYDLNNSYDSLVFSEWIWHVFNGRASHVAMNEMPKGIVRESQGKFDDEGVKS